MKRKQAIIKGTAICHGIAIGKPVIILSSPPPMQEQLLTIEKVESEIIRYRRARAESEVELGALQQKLKHTPQAENAEIFGAQQEMLKETPFTHEIESGIRTTHKCAAAVMQELLQYWEKKFYALPSALFRERFKDLKDAAYRVLGHLHNENRVSLANLPPNSIIFSRELTPSHTAEADNAAIAFVTEFDGVTSHTAIMARARGTPYVSNVDLTTVEKEKSDLVIVDGGTGEVILNPTEETIAHYRALQSQMLADCHQLNRSQMLIAETYDGYNVRLSANLEMVNESDLVHQHGGSGVGLFRSEFIYLTKDKIPSEQEQNSIYRNLVERMRGLPVVIRTFDISGDKQIPASYERRDPEGAILRGRSIRFLIREGNILRTQLRAILRASVYGDVSIMFPMIASLSELRDAKQLMVEAQKDLEKLGEPYGKVRVGCMIEVPSAALVADLLARECDFLSIGTNDLLQYALAIDRISGEEHELHTPAHPSILRLIKLAIQSAHHQGIPVTVCGESASDPRFTALLLGLGVQELSVAPRHIPLIKQTIRNISIVEASRLAEEALNLSTTAEIHQLLAIHTTS